jgi:methionyl-tRNA formyltransferase
MKIIYFGSDEFGIPSLEELKKRDVLLGTVTAPDRPKGRGLKTSCTAVKKWAIQNNIPVHQPETLSDKMFIDTLKVLEPELIILISYGKILPPPVIRIPSVAAINLHPSLLPKYRGAAPMEWTLINGEKETGITVITIKDKIDTGNIIMQKKVVIDETDDIFSLKKRLSETSSGVLIESIEEIKRGIRPAPQRGNPSYARKLTKEDGLIRWEKTASEIHNLIRGTKEWPGAYTYINGRYLKIFHSIPGMEWGEKGAKTGEVIKTDRDSIYVACGEGILQIDEVQMEGKKRMPVSEFLKGYRIKTGDRFFSS